MNIHGLITISQTDPRPMYLQIIEQIERRVAVGDLPPGTELPSIRQLAADLRISVITVKRAYLELERLQVILTRQGKGSVIAEDVGLSQKIHEQELQEHLQQAVELARLLKMSMTEVQRQVADLFKRSQS